MNDIFLVGIAISMSLAKQGIYLSLRQGKQLIAGLAAFSGQNSFSRVEKQITSLPGTSFQTSSATQCLQLLALDDQGVQC